MIAKYLFLFVCITFSSLVHSSETTDLCVSSFVELAQKEIVDESYENRMQHIYFHCGMVSLVNSHKESFWQSNVFATAISAFQELTNKNPNVDEITVGFGRNLNGFTIQYSATLDGFVYIAIKKLF